MLWSDKDEIAARNNRNVTLRKLRVLLEEVGDVTSIKNDSTRKRTITIYKDSIPNR
jgi:hypothetical protein